MVVIVVVATFASRRLEAWDERGRRRLGYSGAAVVGLGVGALLAFSAIVTGLCATWGQQCSADDQDTMKTLFTLALIAPFAAMGSYALLDIVTLRFHRE
jgi:hypothetical protein